MEATLPYLGFMAEEKATFQCSYEVAYGIAKCKKSHTIAEELVSHALKKMVEVIIGSVVKKNQLR